MVDVDVASAVAGGTFDDQRKQGTHREHLSRLSDQFARLMESGAATPERYRELCSTLLRSFEGLRLEQERQIADYNAKIAYCRATQSSCSMFSNLLIGVLKNQVREALNAQQAAVAAVPEAEPGNGRPITDVEMLQRICICGCVDDEDAADCDCSCHRGQPCDRTDCVVCKAQRVLETAGRRQAPEPKRKRAAKKTSRKKAAKKKVDD